MYVETVSTDCMSGALAYLRSQYGDYGYNIGIETTGYGAGILLVRHLDGSEFRIKADRYGNAEQYEPSGEYLAAL